MNPSDDWSDSDDETPASGDQTSLQKRIKILQRKLQQSKADMAEYQALISQRLDLSGLKEDTGNNVAGPSARDDDTHYFQSYEENGMTSSAQRTPYV